MAATGSLYDNSIQPGYQIGPYSLFERFQQGGQSDIWSAWDENVRRVVAVKIVLTELGESAGKKNLEEESGVIARLNHPNILPLYAHGKVERSSYIVMPYLPFGAVSRLLQSGPIKPRTLIPMAAQMAAVLEYLHTHRIVHRDLKPGNFLIDSTMHIYLTDFGLAKPLSDETLPLHTGHGTAPYSSPEQHTKRLVSYTTDIYSLGIVLYELLTGQLPWEGQVALAMRQLESGEELPDPRDVNPYLPAALAPALRRLTAQDPPNRPAAAEAFALVANALQSESDQDITHPLTLEEALGETPPPLTDGERMARDAQRLMSYSLRLWEADSDPFMLNLTNFCLLDSVYADVERFGLVPDEAQRRFMLHGALVYGRGEQVWWSQVDDVATRVGVCERIIVNQNGAARSRAVLRLLGEPLIASGKVRVSPSIQERLVELAVEMQDSALFEGLLVLLSRSSERGSGWQSGQLSGAANQALARLALGGDERARQAAHLIGQARNQDALTLLVGTPSDAYQQARLAMALMEVRQAAGALPRSVPPGLRRRVIAQTVAGQLFAERPQVVRAYLVCALAAALSLGFYVYNLYQLPQFLDSARILNAVGSGLLFGLIIGLGIFASRLSAHRLRVLAPLPRLTAATALGGAILYLGFIGYHVLFLDSSPTGALIVGAALLIALGFAGGALLAVPRLLRGVISAVAIAAAIALSWYLHLVTQATPLLYLEEGQPAHMAFLILIIALCMGFIPHIAGLSPAEATARRS